jgi:hypothetical protein
MGSSCLTALSFTGFPRADLAGMVPRRPRDRTSLRVEFLFALVRMALSGAAEHVVRRDATAGRVGHTVPIGDRRHPEEYGTAH